MKRRLVAVLAATTCVAASLLATAAASAEDSTVLEPTGLLEGIRGTPAGMTDEQGRNVVLRGLNLTEQNSLRPELAQSRWLRPADFARIRAQGFNHVRLNIFWEFVEPTGPGKYDAGYLSRVRALMDMAEDAGLGVVLDFHQDQYSKAVHGRGAPTWAAPQCNRDTVPLDILQGLPWGIFPASGLLQNVSLDIQVAYLNFWEDGFGSTEPGGGPFCTGPVQTYFVNMVGKVVSTVGAHPALIGYDLFNEPFPTGGPGVFETRYLYPFYARDVKAIRQAEAALRIPAGDNRVIFFGNHLLSELATVPVASPDPNAVYGPHVYTEEFFSNEQFTDGGVDDALAMDKYAAEAATLKVPVWYGEWGDTHKTQLGLDYIRTMYDLFDQRGANGAYWEYTKVLETMAAQPGWDAWAPHRRIYPEAYPGPRRTWSYDPASSTLTMQLSGPGVARIVVPESLGEPSWQLTAGSAWYDARGRRVCVRVPDSGTVTLKVSGHSPTQARRGPGCDA